MESLAIHVRQNTRLDGLSSHGKEKVISLVADDTMLMVKCTESNLLALENTLEHFSTMSGLRINFDKSVLIALNENPTWYVSDREGQGH